MPTDLRQSRSYVSYHATFSEAPHPVGRHHILQTHGQQNASDRLYQIAMQATVANAEAFKGACDDGHKLILEDSRPSLNKMKSNKASHKHKTNSNTSTSNNVTSRTKTVHLTPQQWQLLTDYHEHDLFVRTRSWSFCMAVLGVGVTLFGIGSPAWKWIGDARHPYELGLWNLCLPNNSTCLFIIYHLQNNWKLHTSIICLLGCACLFGLLGLGLAITGVCKSALILRLYYYHSAGECFLVSSITTITSLILYPFSAEACIQSLLKLNLFKFKSSSQTTMTSSHTFANNNRNPDDTDKISLESVESQYGYTYFLTWIAAAFFFSSFICMNLDLLIQSFVRPIPTISNVLTYLAPCWGSSVASLTRSPVLSSSSRSSSTHNESSITKQKQRIERGTTNKTENLNSGLKSETSLVYYQSEPPNSQDVYTLPDDSMRDNSQHEHEHPQCQLLNIFLSDYDEEREIMTSQGDSSPTQNSFDNGGEIPNKITIHLDEDGDWI